MLYFPFMLGFILFWTYSHRFSKGEMRISSWIICVMSFIFVGYFLDNTNFSNFYIQESITWILQIVQKLFNVNLFNDQIMIILWSVYFFIVYTYTYIKWNKYSNPSVSLGIAIGSLIVSILLWVELLTNTWLGFDAFIYMFEGWISLLISLISIAFYYAHKKNPSII